MTLRENEERRLLEGHLWAFSNEIAGVEGQPEPGALADLYSARDRFVGRGFYHPHSLIAFRVAARDKIDIDEAFFKKRLVEAFALRQSLYGAEASCRWLFGESDGLPGLIVDRYGDYRAVQILSAGMERLKAVIVSALADVLGPKGVVLRPDAPLRELEGLPQGKAEVVFGEVPDRVQIELAGVKFYTDLRSGQKTGFYFDQRENRRVLGRLCKGKRVLDAFCYTGGFGLSAAAHGASRVVLVDSSEPALELAQANAQLNGVSESCAFVHGDALTLLSQEGQKNQFDIIVLDPPAYARSKKHLPKALKAYEKLNAQAMKMLPRGGWLATSSCSHHVDRAAFLEMLRNAARRAGRRVRLLELRSQAKDHPVLLSMPETEYLKFALLEIG